MKWYNNSMTKFKQGATSFYIVAFSTLILVIIAASFATVILSEIARASNDELSQSAYDSALAGVEDAKLAYSNYQTCKASGVSINNYTYNESDPVSCQKIIYLVEKSSSCDMVAQILGRDYSSEGTIISESNTTSGHTQMNQAYTCVKINTTLDDYRANLTTDNNVRLVRADFANGTNANSINAVKISWYTRNESIENLSWSNFNAGNSYLSGGNRVTFLPAGEKQPATPPTISVQLIQTAGSFTVGQVNSMTSSSGQTDRATMFFVPVSSTSAASGERSGNYYGIYGRNGHSGENYLNSSMVAATNNQAVSKVPFVVYCGDSSSDFACSATIELPSPIGGARSNDTFMLLISLPYGEPETDFSIEYLCSNSSCPYVDDSGNLHSSGASHAQIKGQIAIDSTGRANNLYRRVETRLEASDASFPYTYYALELLGTGTVFDKSMIVTCERNFYDYNYGSPYGSNC